MFLKHEFLLLNGDCSVGVSLSMGAKDFNLDDPRVQLEVFKEKLKHSDIIILQQKQELEKVTSLLSQKEVELKRKVEDYNELHTQLEVQKTQLKFLEEALKQSEKKVAKKNKGTTFYKVVASILFLLATVFGGIGINWLTSNPPVSLGWLMLTLCGMEYLMAAVMTSQIA